MFHDVVHAVKIKVITAIWRYAGFVIICGTKSAMTRATTHRRFFFCNNT
jgi:hypothetical protein